MKSSDYDPPGHVTFGGVSIIGKRKGRGRGGER